MDMINTHYLNKFIRMNFQNEINCQQKDEEMRDEWIRMK